MTTIGNIIHLVFEKYGMIKLFGSAILGLFFFWLFSTTGTLLFKYLSWPFGIFVGIEAIILFIYAYVINPIREAKNRKKKK